MGDWRSTFFSPSRLLTIYGVLFVIILALAILIKSRPSEIQKEPEPAPPTPEPPSDYQRWSSLTKIRGDSPSPVQLNQRITSNEKLHTYNVLDSIAWHPPIALVTTARSNYAARTYRVPLRHVPELDDLSKVIDSYRAKIRLLENELRDLAEQSKRDYMEMAQGKKDAFAPQAGEILSHLQKVAQLRSLAGERRRQYETEINRFRPTGSEALWEYNSKVQRYNDAITRYQTDIAELEKALRTLEADFTQRRNSVVALAQAMNEEFIKVRLARKKSLDDKYAEYHQEVAKVNTLISGYNAKLRQYGTPVLF